MAQLPQRLTKEYTIRGLKITCEALPWDKSEDLLPDIVYLVGLAMEEINAIIPMLGELGVTGALAKLGINGSDEMDIELVWKMAPLLASLLKKFGIQMGNGTLKRLAPLILAGTVVISKDEKGQPKKAELISSSDRAELFDQHPEMYFPILFLAGKVTYGRFFPGLGLGGKAAAKAG